ncbi:MAG TPA: homoserine O-succinyltransferase, partial [Gammaproteobacteria bacterium]|nr:homoserine O-succinyltransferase [Gammaproteobacteria bacterium]
GINTRFETPHSRWNDVPPEQIEAAGMKVLVKSEKAGALAAVSPDQFRFLYFQGHPEYDGNSLLKEYKREVMRFIARERDDYPPYPENYVSPEAAQLLDEYKEKVVAAAGRGAPPPPFPEAEAERHVDNTWTDTGKAVFNNWLGLVYQLTDQDRKIPYMAGVDPSDPLGLADKTADSSVA